MARYHLALSNWRGIVNSGPSYSLVLRRPFCKDWGRSSNKPLGYNEGLGNQGKSSVLGAICEPGTLELQMARIRHSREGRRALSDNAFLSYTSSNSAKASTENYFLPSACFHLYAGLHSGLIWEQGKLVHPW